jgi:hypothetical protein
MRVARSRSRRARPIEEDHMGQVISNMSMSLDGFIEDAKGVTHLRYRVLR